MSVLLFFYYIQGDTMGFFSSASLQRCPVLVSRTTHLCSLQHWAIPSPTVDGGGTGNVRSTEKHHHRPTDRYISFKNKPHPAPLLIHSFCYPVLYTCIRPFVHVPTKTKKKKTLKLESQGGRRKTLNLILPLKHRRRPAGRE